ncbi:MAG: hypothetical protein ACK564_09735 [Novosphingobium sp.]
MRRAAQTLPISPRLLKHFAAATLAITTCIAIFADGSTTEAVAETVKKNEPDVIVSECPLAGPHLKQVIETTGAEAPDRIGHPIEVMAQAYGL